VVRLIGEGLTNRQIGKRMFLAERMAKNHASHLLARRVDGQIAAAPSGALLEVRQTTAGGPLVDTRPDQPAQLLPTGGTARPRASALRGAFPSARERPGGGDHVPTVAGSPTPAI
jgi:hypothetical protein